jgi:hypothetical protein
MITVRQIEKLWNGKAFDRLLEQLLSPRPESSPQLLGGLSGSSAAAAAMAVIRLDELTQSYVPFYSQLIRILIAAQREDGGWGDTMTTALCLRALLCGQGNGQAIERGMGFLANLQKPCGIWPNIPARRMPEDAYASAFVLFNLADSDLFRSHVDADSALAWFESNEITLDEEARKLWAMAKRRQPLAVKPRIAPSSAGNRMAAGSFWDMVPAMSIKPVVSG